MSSSSHKRGLTLMEVATVAACLIVGGAVAVPTLTRVREDAHVVRCARNLGIINQALRMLQQDFPGFHAPLFDDGNAALDPQYRHFGRIATWIDLLQERNYIAARDPGYCPADQLPDPLVAQRGAAWGFDYPVALGGPDNPGADHSYAISVPYSTAADPAQFGCWDPDGDPDKRVIASDGWWTWTHNLGGVALVSGVYDDPWWGANTTGYRHKFAANLLHRDGHVALAAYDIDPADYRPRCNESGLDTTEHFIWRSGESPHVGFSSWYNRCDYPPAECHDYPLGNALNVPDELDPTWYTVNDSWTIPDIYEYKGWFHPTAPGAAETRE
ncbi:MAG: type II secretion system protein [Phycisphaerales bacterium]|nr:MAG: type II secretion system protein [Phycisphaerales bacterium]